MLRRQLCIRKSGWLKRTGVLSSRDRPGILCSLPVLQQFSDSLVAVIIAVKLANIHLPISHQSQLRGLYLLSSRGNPRILESTSALRRIIYSDCELPRETNLAI